MTATSEPISPAPAKLSRRACALLALGIAVFQMSPEWFERYQPGFDESLMLQSGVRMARGDGLTSIWSDRLDDLSKPHYEHLTTWPPLWGLFLAGLLKCGLGIGTAAGVLTAVKTAAAFSGAYGWLRLADGVLPPAATWVFALGLAGVFYGNTPFGNAIFVGPSHLFFWAVMPWWLDRLLTALESDRAGPFFAAGLPAAAAIGVRYAGLYLAPVGALAILLLSALPLRRRLTAAVLSALPAVLTVGAILLFNRICTERAPWILSDTQAGWYWDNLVHRNPLTIWFAFGFGLEETIFKLRPSWRFEQDFAVFLPWYGFLAVAGFAVLRGAAGRFSPEQRRLAAIVAAAAAALIGMLALASVRTSPEQSFVPLGEQRYYSELLPAVAILWLGLLAAALECLPKGRPAWCLAAAACIGFIALECRFVWFSGRMTFRRWREIARSGPFAEPVLETLIRERIAAAPTSRHRVFDSLEGTVASFVWKDDVAVHTMEHMGAATGLARSGNTEPVTVLVVVRWNQSAGAHLAKAHRDTATAWSYVRFLGLGRNPVITAFDRGQLCRVYEGVVQPFRRGERPVPEVELPEPPIVDESVPGLPRP